MRWLLFCFLLAGCTSASLVRPPGEGPAGQQAPPGGAQAFGEVSYLDEGPEFVREARREEALAKMEEACAGSYRIVEEDTRTEKEDHVYGGYGAAHVPPLSSDYRYIRFECVGE